MSQGRRKKRKGKLFLTLIILGLLVFLGADNFGFNWFNFKIDLNNSSNTAQSNSSNNQENDYINIVVKDDIITFNDKAISIDDLESKLAKLDPENTTINLMDNGAYNETFTKIENLLNNKNLQTITSTIIE
ncbi:hypothetical protein SH1V18_05180 [Vallitalea longa]|uniref:Uncharacterized protein n=1 Tax=Vallitalea longa TaxID=2936439 RepID=A0A9W6DE53_9FIRM|nr:hypothetical protein [Vallitalea longa]GKX28038.1 hypothetical protein SH1V18_05180 [Vallitalea longa]